MGLCASQPKEQSTEEAARDAEIAKKAEEDALRDARKIKLLLLGPGESGKSTFFHQFRELYGSEFTLEERKARRRAVHENTVQTIQALVTACADLGVALEDAEAAAAVSSLDYEAPLTPESAAVVARVWADPGAKRAFAERARFQIPDGARTFLDALPRISAPDYVPSVDDVLYSRVRTTGVKVERFEDRNAEGKIERQFELYDVGGQRSERRKWIHCFSDVTAVFFVVALSEYDQVMYEEESENRMLDALRLFQGICSDPAFRSRDPITGATVFTPVMLFLNKVDLFEEKIKTRDIRQPARDGRDGIFLDYEGGCDAEAGKRYFEALFRKQADPAQPVHVHFTTAVSRDNVDTVFATCKQVVLESVVKDL